MNHTKETFLHQTVHNINLMLYALQNLSGNPKELIEYKKVFFVFVFLLKGESYFPDYKNTGRIKHQLEKKRTIVIQVNNNFF